MGKLSLVIQQSVIVAYREDGNFTGTTLVSTSLACLNLELAQLDIVGPQIECSISSALLGGILTN